MDQISIRFISLVIVLTMLSQLVCGCSQTNQTQTDNTTPVNSNGIMVKQLRGEVEKLKKEIEELRIENDNLMISLKSSLENPITFTKQKYIDDYPWLEQFNIDMKWEKIDIGEDINGANCVSITDPILLEHISKMFYIKREVTEDYTNMLCSDIRNFSYRLVGKDVTIIFHVRDRGIIEFDEIPGHYFQVDENIYQPGNAFLKKPNYYPEEILDGILAGSGLMTQEREQLYPWFQSFRIRNVVYAFKMTEKKVIKKPASLPAEYLQKLTFYYFGEKSSMILYNDTIQVNYNGEEILYKVTEDDIRTILSTLAAN